MQEADPRSNDKDVLDLAIVGAGVSGISAAIEARKANLRFAVFESTQPFSTLVNFPKAKPIHTYPSDLVLDGGLQFEADIKEDLVDEVERQRLEAGIEITPARIERLERIDDRIALHHGDGTRSYARQVLVAIGRSGDFRKLGCVGEDSDKVYNRLFDPKDYGGKQVLVVGGGDTALETAIALARAGAKVTGSYRKKEFTRPKPENIEQLDRLVKDGSVRLLLGSTVLPAHRTGRGCVEGFPGAPYNE